MARVPAPNLLAEADLLSWQTTAAFERTHEIELVPTFTVVL